MYIDVFFYKQCILCNENLSTFSFSYILISLALPSPDGLHSRALKELAEEIAEPLSIIFTKTMEEGKLSRILKDATITPIFKKRRKL